MAYFREFSDVAYQLNPMAAFLILGLIFLIASIGGWYTGNLVQWLRDKNPNRQTTAESSKSPLPGADVFRNLDTT
jgi:hypothetical protein